MAEKLCLQWNAFQDNVKTAFGNLRDTSDFVDVTLACEDGRQIGAHKVVLAASSPIFQRILKGNKHNHPLIYMRGIKSDDLTAMIDFLYFGETNVYQENLDSFLALAEELQLKGLEGSKDQQESNEPEQLKPDEKHKTTNSILNDLTPPTEKKSTYNSKEIGGRALAALPKTPVVSENLQELHETVKAMTETSESMIQVGKRQERAKICKVCGIEGHGNYIKHHIESNHLEGVSIPCNLCDKMMRSRHALSLHMSRNHKEH